LMSDEPVVLGDILKAPSAHEGWLFIEPKPWTPQSRGVFVVFDKDADPDDNPVPEWVEKLGWQETIDVNTLEEIVFNATAQLPSPTISQLVDAFAFYLERDAFKVF
jgi:hypothetical protein